MPLVQKSRPAIFAFTALLVACGGGEGAPDAQVATMPQDTFIKPIEREPLTDADMVGFAMAELSLELPWTRNKVSRDPAAGAPAVAIRSAEVASHEGFDRVTFTTGDALLATGYEIRLAEAGTSLSCGSDTHELTAERTLVVTFSPARASGDGDGWPAAGVRNSSAARLDRAGILCDEGSTVTWVAHLSKGDQVRVLEFRDPARVAVDIR